MARIREVHVRNYKSIGEATVDLSPLTIFVGANGAGKSNFLDALGFVADALTDSVELAFKNRGGIAAVRRRSGGHPTTIGMRLVIDLEDHSVADYSFAIAAKKGEAFAVSRERCVLQRFMGPTHRFERRHGEFVEEIQGIRARVPENRLALFAASATEEFRPVYDFLVGMRFYSIVPSELRKLQAPNAGELLQTDGANAAAVLKRIETDDPDRYERVCSLLAAAVSGIVDVRHKAAAQYETVEFRQDVGQAHPWAFDALNVSDGTLRLLGLLLAVYQLGPATVLSVEEPESTVHPAVAEQILEVLQDASRLRQVLVTTHSPDLLDIPDISEDWVRVVRNPRNETIIGPLAETSRAAVRDHLYTTGELLRIGELEADDDIAAERAKQLKLFGPVTVVRPPS